MKQENDPHFDKFEDLIAYFNNVFKITVDKGDWRYSTCTCRFYMKDNKCFHIPIVCASAKIKGCSFDSVFMEMAITRKPRRGRKPGKRTNCLERDEPSSSAPAPSSAPSSAPAPAPRQKRTLRNSQK